MSVADESQRSVQQILSEDILTLTEARRELAEVLGYRVDKSTLFRWCSKGVGGVRLAHVRVGNRILVSRQSLTRFIEARTAAGK